MALMGIRKASALGARARGPIAVVSTASTDGDGTYNTTQDHNLPASIVAGNLLILIVFHSNTSALLTTPSGWTDLAGAFGNASSSCRFYIFYKTATGLEGSTLTVTASLNAHQVSTAYQISKAGPLNLTTNLTSSDPPVSSIVNGGRNLFIAGMGGHATAIGGGVTAAPSNYTGFLEGTYSPSSSSLNPNLGTAHRLLASPSDNPGTFTESGLGFRCSFTLVMEPV